MSVYDIARKARVSQATVSNVLNRPHVSGEVSARTAHRIRRLAEKMDYVPHTAARSLSLGKTNNFVLATTEALYHPYVHELIEAIQKAVATRDYEVLLKTLHSRRTT